MHGMGEALGCEARTAYEALCVCEKVFCTYGVIGYTHRL